MRNIEYPEKSMNEDRAASSDRKALESEIQELEKRVAKNPFLWRAKRILEEKKQALIDLQMKEAGINPNGIERR